METGTTLNEPSVQPDLARQWYVQHRREVLARLSEAAGCSRRDAALLVLALDDDPAIVTCARAVRLAAPTASM